MAEQTTSSPRWMRILLALSLAANLLIIGLALGAYYRHYAHGGSWRGGLDRFLARVDEPRRSEIRALFRESRDQARPLRREARDARRAVFDALEAETFDGEAFKALQRRAVATSVAARRVRFDILPEIASRLNAEERRAFAKFLKRMRRGRRRRWRD